MLERISLAVRAGEFVALAGPNGAGKSTLLRLLAGTLTPVQGTAEMGGVPLWNLGRRAVAQRVAVLPQRLALSFDATVEDLVYLGRIPHAPALAPFRGPSTRDRMAVDEALALTGTAPFRHRTFQELSGGEQQRVALALALAQEPEALLLDEPTSHLDPGHALEILDLVAGLHARRGVTVVAVFHDLNLAALYAERLVLLHQSRVVADGPPGDVLRSAALSIAFGPRLRLLLHPDLGVPQVLPTRLAPAADRAARPPTSP